MMAKDYDSQLLESVSVRRRRMRDALLFGAQRARRTADERLGKVFAGIAVAAVLCAGCVGWSFIQHTLAKQKEQQRQQEQRYAPVTPSPSPTPSATSAKSAHKKATPAKTASMKATPAMSPRPKTTPPKPKGTHKVTEPAQ